MTIYEKLIEEFGAAIVAVYGDVADKDFSKELISNSDIDAIAKKVKFYLD